nr:ATP-binding cassette domain-containing protein [Flaviflexus huanghaiensis]
MGSSQILSGIDLDIAEGTTMAILGPNGSGKSSLVRAVLGIYPHTGSIELLGQTLPGRHVEWGKIGYAPQRPTSTAGVPATALEVVASGLLYGRSLRFKKGHKDRAMAALDSVGLAHRAGESVQTFSGGQQQRVMLARALVSNPSLLFLDEPFSGVDKESRETLTATLTKKHDEGLTIVVVLHELQNLRPLIDHTIVIEHGRIVHRGDAPRVAPGHDDPDHDHEHEHTAEWMSFRTPDMEGL